MSEKVKLAKVLVKGSIKNTLGTRLEFTASIGPNQRHPKTQELLEPYKAVIAAIVQLAQISEVYDFGKEAAHAFARGQLSVVKKPAAAAAESAANAADSVANANAICLANDGKERDWSMEEAMASTKASNWFFALSEIASILELPKDEPIPRGVVAEVRAKVAELEREQERNSTLTKALLKVGIDAAELLEAMVSNSLDTMAKKLEGKTSAMLVVQDSYIDCFDMVNKWRAGRVEKDLPAHEGGLYNAVVWFKETVEELEEKVSELSEDNEAVSELVDKLTADLHKAQNTLKFVERWVNHHGQHPKISAPEVLSMIQHYPCIVEITKSYADGVVPVTRNPWAELEQAQNRIFDMIENPEGQSFKEARKYLQEHRPDLGLGESDG